MFELLLIATSVLWTGAIITQEVSVALIAAISSVVNTLLALKIRDAARENSAKIDKQRIVITRTDKGFIVTDEETRELEPRPGPDWEWPNSR